MGRSYKLYKKTKFAEKDFYKPKLWLDRQWNRRMWRCINLSKKYRVIRKKVKFSNVGGIISNSMLKKLSDWDSIY